MEKEYMLVVDGDIKLDNLSREELEVEINRLYDWERETAVVYEVKIMDIVKKYTIE